MNDKRNSVSVWDVYLGRQRHAWVFRHFAAGLAEDLGLVRGVQAMTENE